MKALVNPPEMGNGRGDRIRTDGPLRPRQVLYQTELHPEYRGPTWDLSVEAPPRRTSKGVVQGSPGPRLHTFAS